METICQQCGDKGFEYAFVYCVKCLNFAVHRYCLPRLPETFDEFVYWFCEDCKPIHTKQSPLEKPCATPSTERDHVISKGVGLTHSGIRLKKTDATPSVAEPEEQKCQSNPSQQPCGAHTKHALCAGSEHALSCSPLHEDRTIHSCSENHGNDLKLGKRRRLVLKEGSELGEEAESVRIADSQTAAGDLSNDLEYNYRLHAQPVIDPIWRGSFSICNKDDGLVDGVVAHLSSKACPKVCEEAGLLPTLLCSEMLPKTSVWPKSFQRSEPCDDNIALYFFPGDERYEKVFDLLVDDMMHQELAMRAIVRNAELLVFPSTELPLLFWRFQGKHYLWGVFRKKQASSSPPANHHLVDPNSNVEYVSYTNSANGAGTREERNLTKTKTLDAWSPLSHLSNSSSLGMRNGNLKIDELTWPVSVQAIWNNYVDIIKKKIG